MSTDDWTIFDRYTESTCTCGCSTVFRSHARMRMSPIPVLVSRRPCPGCGRTDDLRSASSDSEAFTITGSNR